MLLFAGYRPSFRKFRRSRPMRPARAVILIAAVTTAAAATIAGPAARAAGPARPPDSLGQPGATVAYPDLRLPDGRRALVYSDGLAEVSDRTGSQTEFTWVPPAAADPDGAGLPDRGQLTADLMSPSSAPYVAQDVVAIYRDAAP